MNTRTDHDPSPRRFGVRAAALAGLLIVIGTADPAEVGTIGTMPEFVIADVDHHTNPSTCCGTP